ncbi:MAG: hypothetical protein VB021_05910 [Oscillospiraceae bacterium]|nr:hypothetical protein [Oscillospiraceae bacterium]
MRYLNEIPYSLGIAQCLLLLLGCIVYAALAILRTSHIDIRRRRGFAAYPILAAVFCGAAAFCCASVIYQANERLPAQAYPWLPWLCLAPAAAALYCAHAARAPACCADAAAFCAFLPVTDGQVRGALLTAALLWLAARASYLLYAEFGYISRHISRLSVKDAFDNLPEGVLITDAGNAPVLVNAQMQALLASLGIGDGSGGRPLWEILCRDPLPDGISRRLVRDDLLVRTADARAWLFRRQTLDIGGAACRQIIAAEVTKQDALGARLSRRNEELDEVNRLLEEEIGRLDETEHERQIVLAKSHLHDVLGQRLSIVHQFIENPRAGAAHIGEIRELIRGIAADVKSPSAADSGEALRRLCATFYMVGTRILITGSLPDGEPQRRVLLYVIREAATNAVRHAKADEVDVTLRRQAGRLYCSISNNGAPPAGKLAEGDGIRGMRYRVEELGGTLRIVRTPRFCVRVSLPCA